MLTGRRAFEGEDVTETLAAIIKGDPDWPALPAAVPTPIVTLLRSCLTKDRRERSGDIAAAMFVMRHAEELVARMNVPAGVVHTAVVPQLPLWRRAIAMIAALAITALLAGTIVWTLSRPRAPSVVRTTIVTSASTALSVAGENSDVAITPDGSRILYRGNNQLVVRALNQLEPTVLGGLNAPRGVFISPDGEWVGFFENFFLKKVAITGGPSVPITPATVGARGATWGPDGTIVFAPSGTGLQRVSAAGGIPTVLTKPDRERGEFQHMWPEFLPGGKAILFTILPTGGAVENAQIAALDLRTGKSKVLVRGGSDAHYIPTGHLVYGYAGTLRAVGFDLGRLEVVATPVPMLDGVMTTQSGAADLAVAGNGSIVYIPGASFVGSRNTVVSVDREGRASPLTSVSPNTYRDVRVSPDGTRLALATNDDVWIYDLGRATLSRLTMDPAPDTRPLWTPDGQRIVFRSDRAGYAELFWRRGDGTGSDERLLSRGKDLLDLRGNDWSPDGKQLLLTEVPAPGHCALEQIAIERPSDVKVLLKSDFCNDFAVVSPDGRWIAYDSNQSTRSEVYVERYPQLGDRQQISTSGGVHPHWSRDGRELVFGTPDDRQMLAVPVQSGTKLMAGRPELLFESAMMPPRAGTRPYDMAPDGRFYIIRSAQSETTAPTPSNMVLVLNWSEELKQRVPTR